MTRYNYYEEPKVQSFVNALFAKKYLNRTIQYFDLLFIDFMS